MKKPKNKTKKKAKAKSQQPKTSKRLPIKTDAMHICLYSSIAFMGIFTLLVSLFFNHTNPYYFISFVFLFFISAISFFCLSWFIRNPNSKNKILSTFTILSVIAILVTFILSNVLIKEIPLPTFSDAIKNIIVPGFSLGTRGMSFGGSKHNIVIGKYEPFKSYIENGKLYVDLEIYSKTGFPPIKIQKNVLYNLPDNWDRNSNDIAIEIVNENKQALYQLVYEKPFNINIKGLFPTPNGFIFADDIHGIDFISYEFLMKNPAKYKLNRIFKYPSWRYPGEYKGKY